MDSGVITFAILGLGSGAAYALLAQGLILIYRGSGVLNFAQGAFAMTGAYIFYEFQVQHGVSFGVAFCVSVVLTALLAAATQFIIMGPLRRASSLARLIATLGILAVLDAVGTIRYGSNLVEVPSELPQTLVHIFGTTISADRLWLLLIAVSLTAVLYSLVRFTTFGLAISAAAENRRAASTLGWSPSILAISTWAAGGALAGAAGIFIAPLSGLEVENLTLLVIPALAAALFGGFSSFPLTLCAALAIGILQSEMARYVTTPGLSDAMPFFVIMLVLLVRGKALPLRGEVLDRLPRLGTGAPNRVLLVAAVAICAIGMLTVFPQGLTIAITIQLGFGLVLLSVVVVTGYAGQVSLAQFALAGMGAFIAGRLVAVVHVPFALAMLAGVVGAGLFGLLFALPALRTRGVNLAVVTLGLGLAVQEILFDNAAYTGGNAGTTVGPASFLGIGIDPILTPARYGIFCLAMFVVASLMVANVRRGRVGRRLVAIRTNERAAASMGVSVFGSKLFAFAFGSAIAGLGGILIAFANYAIVYSNFDPLTSINAVVDSVIGGIGYVTGPIAGSGLYQGGIGSYVLDRFGGLDEWLPLIGGVLLLGTLLLNQDGIVGEISSGRGDPVTRFLAKKLRPRRRPSAELLGAGDGDRVEAESGARAGLTATDVTVRFGGVLALSDASVSVKPGEIVGLIGPNGAGKTTLIDAITGFVRPSAGRIELDGADIGKLGPHERARCGIGRSWQSLELFEDLTVFENLQAAADPRDRRAYATNLLASGKRALTRSGVDAVTEFGLTDCLDQYPEALPYGRRRLVSIARAAAARPSVLLLDEPAAGLDEAETSECARLIRRLADEWQLAVLLVEHDMNMVMEISDRLVVLNFGRVIAAGDTEDVRQHPDVIAAYLGASDDASSLREADPR